MNAPAVSVSATTTTTAAAAASFIVEVVHLQLLLSTLLVIQVEAHQVAASNALHVVQYRLQWRFLQIAILLPTDAQCRQEMRGK